MDQEQPLGDLSSEYQRIMLIRANADKFNDLKWLTATLDIIRLRLELDITIWNWQQPFLHNLLQSFFGKASNAPAWIKLDPIRAPFRARTKELAISTKQEGKVLQDGSFLADGLGQQPLILNNIPVPTTRLLMARSKLSEGLSIRDRHLRVQRLEISRKMLPTGCGQTLHTTENWYYLGSPADGSELRMIRRGLNPSTEWYRDTSTKVQTSPLISLCRLEKSRKFVISRCFSLTPEGRFVDFRDGIQRLQYYMQSCVSNHTILHRSATPSTSERF